MERGKRKEDMTANSGEELRRDGRQERRNRTEGRGEERKEVRVMVDRGREREATKMTCISSYTHVSTKAQHRSIDTEAFSKWLTSPYILVNIIKQVIFVLSINVFNNNNKIMSADHCALTIILSESSLQRTTKL